MFPPREPRPEHGTPLLAALAAAAVALPLAACGRDEPDLTNGKAMFTQKCGSCHTLARAGTQGRPAPTSTPPSGPRWRRASPRHRRGRRPPADPPPRRNSVMPAGLVTGPARQGRGRLRRPTRSTGAGEDTGALAKAGLAGATTGRADLHRRRLRRLPQALQGGRDRQHRPEPERPGQRAGRQGRAPRTTSSQSIVDPNAVIVRASGRRDARRSRAS